MPGPKGNTNAQKHGLRTKYRDGLTLGRLPAGCSWLRRKVSCFRLALESAVLDTVGELGIVDVAVVQTACRWEVHAELCRRWLCEGDLTPEQKLAFSKQVAWASSQRDGCLAKLRIDRRETDHMLALYQRPLDAVLCDCSEDDVEHTLRFTKSAQKRTWRIVVDGKRLQALMASPSAFRDVLLVDTDAGPRPLGRVMDDWQREDFQCLDRGWRKVAGQSKQGGVQRAYLERPRGHSKTADLAVMTCWALFTSRRRLSSVAAAADLDQARLLRDAVSRLVALNGWLGDFLNVQRYRVTNRHTGSDLVVLASDAPSSFGLTPDFIVLDELTHWESEALWVSLLSASAKRRDCVLVIISNAGHSRGNCWQWTLRESARTDSAWHFHHLDGPQASWITSDRLCEQQRLLPPFAYAQYWGNHWQAEAGNALSEADVRACVVLDGPIPWREQGMGYGLGVDIGLSRHHAAIVVVATDFQRRKIQVVDVLDFSPPVKVEHVFQAILDARDRFGVNYVAADPWQFAHAGQRLVQEGFHVEFVKPVGQVLDTQASTLLEIFKDRNIELYDDALLIGDLLRLAIVPRSYGYRLQSPETETGHGDRASALANILPYALEATITLSGTAVADGLGGSIFGAAGPPSYLL